MEIIHHSVAGHLGVKKLLSRFRERYAATKERQFAEEVVKDCHGCQVGSDYNHKPVPLGKIPGDYPWHTLSVDITGPFPVMNGKRFIITFLDIFTGYCILVPSADHTANTVARVIFE